MEDVNSCTAVDCNIYNTGLVECPLPCEHTAYCKGADHTNWPFDSASCQFTYMSRTQNTKALMIYGQTITVDQKFGALNRAWDLISIYGQYGNQSSDFVVSSLDANATFSFIKMNFNIRRHSPEMIFQVVIPAVIVAIMNIFTLILDANMSERWILFSLGIFGNWIYNIQLQFMLPANSDSVPKIFVFFCDSQIITTVLMIESLLTKIYIKNDDDESEFIRVIMNFLKRTWYGQVIIYQETLDTVKIDSSNFRFNVSRLIDRILILTLVIVYSLMFYSLMPTQIYEDNAQMTNFVLESDY